MFCLQLRLRNVSDRWNILFTAAARIDDDTTGTGRINMGITVAAKMTTQPIEDTAVERPNDSWHYN